MYRKVIIVHETYQNRSSRRITLSRRDYASKSSMRQNPTYGNLTVTLK